MNKPIARSSGFTLLELILALAMISMLALSLYQGLRIGFRARASAHDAVATMRRASVAMDLLRRDIEGALPPKGLLAGPMIGYSSTAGQGDSDSLEFYCVGADPGRVGVDDVDNALFRPEGIRRVQLSLEATPGRFGGSSPDNSLALVRRVSTNLLAPTEILPEPEIICRNVRSFSLRYFDGEVWQEEWDSTQWGDVLPTAIEVIMDLDPIEGDEPLAGGNPYRVVRVFTMPCAETPTLTDATGLGL